MLVLCCCTGFFLVAAVRGPGLLSSCSVWALHCAGFSCCEARALRACGLFIFLIKFSVVITHVCIDLQSTRALAHVILHACALSHFSHAQLCAALWTAACQPPLSKAFSKQESWSGLPCPPSGNLPDPGIESVHYLT